MKRLYPSGESTREMRDSVQSTQRIVVLIEKRYSILGHRERIEISTKESSWFPGNGITSGPMLCPSLLRHFFREAGEGFKNVHELPQEVEVRRGFCANLPQRAELSQHYSLGVDRLHDRKDIFHMLWRSHRSWGWVRSADICWYAPRESRDAPGGGISRSSALPATGAAFDVCKELMCRAGRSGQGNSATLCPHPFFSIIILARDQGRRQ